MSALAGRVTQTLDDGESRRILPPLTGVKKTPLVSLEEAVASLEHLPVHEGVRDDAFLASSYAEEKERGESGHVLPARLMGSIILYTLETALYPELNRALRDANRDKVKPYFAFIRLFVEALVKLPVFTGTVCRGVNKRLPEEDYTVGKKFFWWQFSSCTMNQNLLNDPQFCGTTGARTIFIIETCSGRNITRYSMMPHEEEVLLPCGLQFEVTHRMTVPGTECDVISIRESSSRMVPWPGNPPAQPEPASAPFAPATAAGGAKVRGHNGAR